MTYSTTAEAFDFPGGVTRVLIIGIDVPRTESEHAGGRYLRDVQRFFENRQIYATFVGPNRQSVNYATSGPTGHFRLIGLRGALAERAQEWLRRRIWHFRPVSADYRLALAISFSRSLRRMIREASVIDLQWAETGSLIRRVRRLNRHAKIVVTMHDVLGQKYERRLASALPSTRRRWQRALDASIHLTENICSEADAIGVLSAKDASLLPSCRASIVVIPPVTKEAVPPCAREGESAFRAVFVGAMSRPENDAAALWLLKEIWPRIVSEIPEASLSIVGSRPSPSVVQKASDSRNVTVTGFVDNIDPYYLRSLVAILPLRSGAGVKFKTIDALLAGCAVVSTTIGSEGIGSSDWYWAISDDAPKLANEVVKAFANPDLAVEFGRVAASKAAAYYNTKNQDGALRKLYAA